MLHLRLLLVLTLACAVATAATLRAVETTFDTCTRDRGIDTTTVAGQAQLAPVEYFVDDTGARLGRAAKDGSWPGKKVFTLDAPQATGARLYTFRTVAKSAFNGVPLTFKAQGAGTGVWVVAEIPADVLKAGDNEFQLLSGNGLAVDTDANAGKSFVSPDGGKTWQPAAGEFLAHLAVLRHPAQGVLTSDVIDLANPEHAPIVCPRITVSKIALTAASQLPAGTAIVLEARTGDTMRPDASWSDWTTKRPQPARYVQWRATLTTKDHRVTPVLEAVTVTAEAKTQQAADLVVTKCENPRNIRSSFPFTYQPPSEKLTRLRQEWKLDEVVASGKTELEKYILLRNWVRKQWPHNEGNCARPWDAISILSAPAGDHGMCVHYGVLFTQCALALGYNARQVILSHHYVSEIWVNDLRKWVLMDVETVQKEGWDRYGTALYVDKATGVPLNGIELHRAWQANTVDQITQLMSMTEPDGTFKPNERTYGKDEYSNFAVVAYPPRNNYLDQLEPWEVQHGVDYYHYNGYYWWSDGAMPDSAEYSVFSSRPGDILWTLNQAAMTLTADGDKLDVQVETVTPNFAEFRYRLNGGAWQSLPAPGEGPDRQARFAMALRPGANTLEITPRNAFGHDGIVSSVTIVKQ